MGRPGGSDVAATGSSHRSRAFSDVRMMSLVQQEGRRGRKVYIQIYIYIYIYIGGLMVTPLIYRTDSREFKSWRKSVTELLKYQKHSAQHMNCFHLRVQENCEELLL